jgi:hypothetical protein
VFAYEVLVTKKIHIMGKKNLKKSNEETEFDVFKKFRNNDPECNLVSLQEKFMERLKSDTCIDDKAVIKSEYEKMQKLTRTYMDPGEDIDQVCFLEGVLGAEANNFKFIEGNGENIGTPGVLSFTKGWAAYEYLVWLRKNYSKELGLNNSNTKNDFSDIKWKGKVNEMAQLIHVLYSSKRIYKGDEPVQKKDLEEIFSKLFSQEFKNTSDSLGKLLDTNKNEDGKIFIDELHGYLKDSKK